MHGETSDLRTDTESHRAETAAGFTESGPRLDHVEADIRGLVTGFFIRVRDDLGFDGVRLHHLRHFTAPQLMGAGIDVRTVDGRLGHSDPSLTLRVYSHVIEERDRAAAAVIGRVLSPPEAPAEGVPTAQNRFVGLSK